MRKSAVENNSRMSVASSRFRKRTNSFDGVRKSNVPVFKKGPSFGGNATPGPTVLGANKSYRKSSISNFCGVGRVSISTAESKRETRPIYDRVFQQKCILNLVEFLEGHHYPYVITAKGLQSPSNKDFIQVFQFLYQFVDKTYTIAPGTKMEEEIPRLFKELNYPIPIQKSHLLSVGSSRSWPVLLSALDWLRNFVTIGLLMAENPIQNDFEDSNERQLFAPFNFKAYATFLSGGDDYSAHFNELKAQNVGMSESDVENYGKKIEELEKEVQLLQTEEDQLPKLENDLQLMTGDQEKFNAYLEELKSYTENKKQHNELLNISCVQEEEKINQLNADSEEKKKLIEMQDNCKYEEMRNRHEEQVKQKYLIESQLAEIADANGLGEIDMSKNKEKIDSVCKEYNTLCRQVRLIPQTEQFAENQDFEILFTFGKDLSDHVDQVKTMINNKVKQVNENLLLTKNLLDVNSYGEGLENLVADGERNDKKTEQMLCAVDKAIKETKEANMKAIQESEAELDTLKEQLADRNKQQQKMKKCEIQHKYKATKEKLEETKCQEAKITKDARAIYEKVLTMHDMMDKHMEKTLKKHMKVVLKLKSALT